MRDLVVLGCYGAGFIALLLGGFLLFQDELVLGVQLILGAPFLLGFGLLCETVASIDKQLDTRSSSHGSTNHKATGDKYLDGISSDPSAPKKEFGVSVENGLIVVDDGETRRSFGTMLEAQDYMEGRDS